MTKSVCLVNDVKHATNSSRPANRPSTPTDLDVSATNVQYNTNIHTVTLAYYDANLVKDAPH